MGTFTALVLSRTGTISAIQPGAGEWGKKECPPVFQLVEVTTTLKGVEWLLQRGAYDGNQFIDRETKEPFDLATDVIEDGDFNQDLFRCQQLATELNGGQRPEGTACDFLRAKHIPQGEDDRRYFLKLFWPHRKLPGVRALLRAAKKGLYPDIREGLRALDAETMQAILSAWGPHDQDYFLWLRNAGSDDVDN